MFTSFRNEQIVLNRFTVEDAELIYQALIESKSEISPWLTWLTPDYSQNHANDFIKIQIKNWDDNSEYTMTIKNVQGDLLGVIGLHLFDKQNDVANVGYWMNTKHTGNGYCSQALRLLIKNSLVPLNLIRIEVVVAINNIASQKVAENAGGRFEAILRNRIRLNGEAVDAKVYAFINFFNSSLK